MFKGIASSVTIGSGGSAGTFAPSLFLGAFTGFLFARVINITSIAAISEQNFALVGMCGAISGIHYAPLTAIFLIAELTQGYTLFMPLMIVAAISFSTVTYFESNSPYIRRLIERGDWVEGTTDKKILHELSIKSVIEKDIKPIHKNAVLKDLLILISKSKRNIFPVIDDDNVLIGIVTLDNVREIMFNKEDQSKTNISSLMESPPAKIEYEEDMESVMQKFEITQAWNLPVVKNNRYIGFVSKSRIFSIYRNKLLIYN